MLVILFVLKIVSDENIVYIYTLEKQFLNDFHFTVEHLATYFFKDLKRGS
jgi:hypothetical protein